MSERDRSDRAASPDAPKAKLVERYAVPSGIGRVLALADGTRLRLEPREDGVAVGWTTKVDALTAATTFKRFVGSNIQVHVVHGGSLEETNNSDLLDFVGRFDNVELIRVDRAEDSIAWEAASPPSESELSVLTSSWAAAGNLASDLGAREIGSTLLELVKVA